MYLKLGQKTHHTYTHKSNQAQVHAYSIHLFSHMQVSLLQRHNYGTHLGQRQNDRTGQLLTEHTNWITDMEGMEGSATQLGTHTHTKENPNVSFKLYQ